MFNNVTFPTRPSLTRDGQKRVPVHANLHVVIVLSFMHYGLDSVPHGDPWQLGVDHMLITCQSESTDHMHTSLHSSEPIMYLSNALLFHGYFWPIIGQSDSLSSE